MVGYGHVKEYTEKPSVVVLFNIHTSLTKASPTSFQ